MDSLANTSMAATPSLTFTYTAADIQGLAEPTHGDRAASGAEISTPRIVALPIAPYNTVEVLIQQQQKTLPSPKQPRVRGRMTPYAFFVMERREVYRKQSLPVQFAAFSKECSSLWRTKSEEEKQKYHKLAEEDRERYQREVSGGYVKPLAKDGTRRGRRKKEPGQPKRNICGQVEETVDISIALLMRRPKLKEDNPSLSVGALAKQLSVVWKVLTPEERKPYDAMAERDKQRYEQQKQAYEAGYSAAFLRRDLPPGLQVGVMTHMVPRQRRKKKDPDMPKRNMSAFMFYSLDKRPGIKADNPTFGVGKLAQLLAQHWRVMTSSEREPYDMMARKDKERYESALRAYKQGLYGMGRRTTPIVPQAIVTSTAEEEEKEKSETEQELPDESDGQGEESELGQNELEQLCELYQ